MFASLKSRAATARRYTKNAYGLSGVFLCDAVALGKIALDRAWASISAQLRLLSLDQPFAYGIAGKTGDVVQTQPFHDVGPMHVNGL